MDLDLATAGTPFEDHIVVDLARYATAAATVLVVALTLRLLWKVRTPPPGLYARMLALAGACVILGFDRWSLLGQSPGWQAPASAIVVALGLWGLSHTDPRWTGAAGGQRAAELDGLEHRLQRHAEGGPAGGTTPDHPRKPSG